MFTISRIKICFTHFVIDCKIRVNLVVVVVRLQRYNVEVNRTCQPLSATHFIVNIVELYTRLCYDKRGFWLSQRFFKGHLALAL